MPRDTVYAQMKGPNGLIKFIGRRMLGGEVQYGTWSLVRQTWIQKMKSREEMRAALIPMVEKRLVRLTHHGADLFREDVAA